MMLPTQGAVSHINISSQLFYVTPLANVGVVCVHAHDCSSNHTTHTCTVPSTHTFTLARARHARDSIECNNDSHALTQSKTAGTKTFTINSLKLT